MQTPILTLRTTIWVLMSGAFILASMFLMQTVAYAQEVQTFVAQSEEDHSHESEDDDHEHEEDHNHESEDGSIMEEVQAGTSENDTYTVIEGDNLTKLVRRSIMNLNDSTDSIDLTSGEIVYVETSIVHDMQCDVIYPGQEISVSHQMILDYAQAAEGLSAAQRSSWDRYATNASFVLGDRVAQSTESSSITSGTSGEEDSQSGSGDVNTEENEDSNSTNTDDGDETSSSEDDDKDDQSDDDDNGSSSSNLWWWIIGGGAIAGGWYILGNRKNSSK